MTYHPYQAAIDAGERDALLDEREEALQALAEAEREADFAMARVAECEARVREAETKLGRRKEDRR